MKTIVKNNGQEITVIAEYTRNHIEDVIYSIREAIYKVESLGFRRNEIKIWMPNYLHRFFAEYNRYIFGQYRPAQMMELMKEFEGVEVKANYQNLIAVSIEEFERCPEHLPVIIELKQVQDGGE